MPNYLIMHQLQHDIRRAFCYFKNPEAIAAPDRSFGALDLGVERLVLELSELVTSFAIKSRAKNLECMGSARVGRRESCV